MCAGNHERDWPNSGDRYLQENAKDSGGECGVVFEKRIPMPIPHPGQQWYSSSVFLVFFASLVFFFTSFLFLALLVCPLEMPLDKCNP
jgi:hypothetical protein